MTRLAIRRFGITAALLCGLLYLPAWLVAQTRRPVTTFRQWRGERHLTARVRLAGGSFRLVPGRRNELYRTTIAYAGDDFSPIDAYDPADTTLRIGHLSALDEVTDSEAFEIQIGDDEHVASPATTLALAPEADVTLRLSLADLESDLDLGELRLAALHVTSTYAKTTIRFSRPNPIACTEARVNASLGELSLVGLGNSGCERLVLRGTLVAVLLDFSGASGANGTVRASVTAGALKLRLPRGLGVRVTMRKKLSADFDASGFVREGDSYISPGYEAASRRLDIDASTTLGGTAVEWIDE